MSINERAPKPKPPVKKPDSQKEEKKPFIRKAHLMQRPFSDEALLEKLRKQTSTDTTKKDTTK